MYLLLTQLAFRSPVPHLSDEEIMAEPISSSKSNTILMDVQRTRSSFFSRQLKAEMEKMLNHFCRLGRLDYKQGLNEILAPFAYFRVAGLPLSKCYALFKSFFDTYCLNFYYDKVPARPRRTSIASRSSSAWSPWSSSTTTPPSPATWRTTRSSRRSTASAG